jgi:hypothetical protein
VTIGMAVVVRSQAITAVLRGLRAAVKSRDAQRARAKTSSPRACVFRTETQK